jgi:hypothetical protein
MLSLVIASAAVTLVLAYIYGKLSSESEDGSRNPLNSALRLLFFCFTLTSLFFTGFTAWFSLQSHSVTTTNVYTPFNQTYYVNQTGSYEVNSYTTVYQLANSTVTDAYPTLQAATEGWLSMLALLLWLPVMLFIVFFTLYGLVWLYEFYQQRNKPKSILDEEPRL